VPLGAAAEAAADTPFPRSLTALWDMPHQGEAAERAMRYVVADKYAISREACDAYGVRSHLAAHAAWEAHRFDAELAPVSVDGIVLLQRDEGVRPDSCLEKAAALSPSTVPTA
jgi:acetyl-CoA acetyltransferase